MSGNARSTALGSRLEGLDAPQLLALARMAVRAAASAPLEGDAEGLVPSVVGCHQLEASVHAEKLRRVAAVDRQGAFRGLAHNSVNLWVSRLGLGRGEARTLVDSARALERMPAAAAAHAQGLLAAGHVADATRAVAQLDRLATGTADGDRPATPGEADEAVQALDTLVAEQAQAAVGLDCPATAEPGGDDPEGVGAGVRDTTAGGEPEALVGRLVLRQRLEEFQRTRAPHLLVGRERRLHANRSLRLARSQTDPDEQPWLDAKLAPVTYSKARTVIHALARKHPAGDPRSFEQRCHDALDRVLDLAIASGELPEMAGEQPRVLLHVTPDALHDRPEAVPARLDGYGDVSPQTARQICCDAEITAVVTTDGREALNVGRDRRSPTRRQRRAVFARDGACIGCGAPLAYCQVHHVVHWERGGPTDIANLVAVCWGCHTNLHHHDWRVVRHADGDYHLRRPGGPRPDTQR